MTSKIPWAATAGFLAASLAICTASSAAARDHRLPQGYKWGRCLLIVGKQTRINGRCAYSIEKNGDFDIQGPRQIYGGIDFPEAEIMAAQYSRDYWALVFRDRSLPHGGRSGYGNGEISSVHGEHSWENLQKNGACYTGKENFTGKHVRLCLWKR
jgi:hypothetical protein